MFWHSTSVHILLAAYPIMLFSGGDIRPSVRYMGKCFLLLLAMAVPIYCVNLLLDTNFMFLMYAPDGNPLAWFRDHVGYHWIGFPVLLVAVFALMDRDRILLFQVCFLQNSSKPAAAISV